MTKWIRITNADANWVYCHPCSSPFLPNIKSIVDLQVAFVVIIKKLQKAKYDGIWLYHTTIEENINVILFYSMQWKHHFKFITMMICAIYNTIKNNTRSWWPTNLYSTTDRNPCTRKLTPEYIKSRQYVTSNKETLQKIRKERKNCNWEIMEVINWNDKTMIAWLFYATFKRNISSYYEIVCVNVYICTIKFNVFRINITFDLAEYDPLANSPEGVVSSGISCV